MIVIGMLAAANLWAVTPQSARQPKQAPERVSTLKKTNKQQRSAVKEEQEVQPLVSPAEYYNAQLIDQKTAKKQYKQRKKKIKSTHAEPVAEDIQRLKMDEMTYAQLCQRKNELIVMGDYDTAIRYLERMLRTIERPEQVMFIMLELGELFMKSGNYSKAERMYFDFVKLYPSSQFAEQAYVKAIECSWMQTLQPDRDQTKTERTLTLIEEFLTRDSIYSADSIAQVMAINEKCRRRLADSNLLIVKQYITRGQYTAAHKRIDAMTEDMPKTTFIEPDLLQVRLELAQAEGKSELAQQLHADLQQRFPAHSITMASNKPTWKRWLGL
jgi:outer membrane assembly lipoprotein YfiO